MNISALMLWSCASRGTMFDLRGSGVASFISDRISLEIEAKVLTTSTVCWDEETFQTLIFRLLACDQLDSNTNLCIGYPFQSLDKFSEKVRSSWDGLAVEAARNVPETIDERAEKNRALNHDASSATEERGGIMDEK